MTQDRIITGIILTILTSLVVVSGWYYPVIAIGVLAVIFVVAVYEYLNLLPVSCLVMRIFLLIAIPSGAFSAMVYFQPLYILYMLVPVVMSFIAFSILPATYGLRLFIIVTGIFLLVLSCMSLVELYRQPRLLLLLFAVIVTTDVCAYACGTKWGKSKMWPRLSPNKSWQGAACALLGSVSISILASLVLPITLGQAVGLGIVISLCAIAGDSLLVYLNAYTELKILGAVWVVMVECWIEWIASY